MKLDTITRKLEVLLAGTVSTTACPVVACYRDENRNAPQNLGAVPSATQDLTVSSVTASTFISAPSVNTIIRVPERISFKNSDTGTVIPTFRLNDNTTTYPIWSPTLLTGESCFYEEHRGWYATDVNGAVKTALGPDGAFRNLTVSGNTTLGDAAADSLTINAGVISYPNVPSFLAYDSADDTNVTGAGTTYSYICDTEVFDQGSNYNNSTGVFTAPVTGRYLLQAQVRASDLTVAMTGLRINMTTSNRTYATQSVETTQSFSTQTLNISVVADMDAGDTAFPQVQVASGAGDTADVIGSGSPLWTFFSGEQIA